MNNINDLIALQPWMTKDLNMDVTHACVYAVVYGHSMDHQGCYCGGIEYIADILNTPKDVIEECWNNLESVGLIKKVCEVKPNVFGYEAFTEREV